MNVFLFLYILPILSVFDLLIFAYDGIKLYLIVW